MKFGATVNDSPTLSPKDDRLRVKLISEEADELWEAEQELEAAKWLADGNNLAEEGVKKARIAIADALGDLAYVIYGAGVTYGINIIEAPSPDAFGQDSVAMIFVKMGDLISAMNYRHLVGMNRALGDLIDIVWETSFAHNIPLDSVVREIHRSNMTKLHTDGEILSICGAQILENRDELKVFGGTARRIADDDRAWIVKRYPDGKVIKSPSYSPANLAPLIS